MRTSSSIVGETVLAGELVAYSMRKLWVRFSPAQLRQTGKELTGKLSLGDSAIVPAAALEGSDDSPLGAGSDAGSKPTAFKAPVYAAISDFTPDRVDRPKGHPLDVGSARESFLIVESLRDQVLRELDESLRNPSVRGVSIDIRMAGEGEALDLLRLLARVREKVGGSRKVIASVPGEWFCRKQVGNRMFKSAVAGFAVPDMLEYVDVVVARCWRDPALSGARGVPLTSADFARDVIAAAVKLVPCWRLAAGLMCGAAVMVDSPQTDDSSGGYLDAQEVDELGRRFIVRRRYYPESDSLKAYLVSRNVRGELWYEDTRTLPKRLALVNRRNLLGVELFWPDHRGNIIDLCRRWFLPLQDFAD